MATTRWTAFHYLMWIWCWLCFKAYMALPVAGSNKSRYGRCNLWLLSYAGCYANSDRATFPLCRFFFRSNAEQSESWDEFVKGPGA
jgi:hypothetical protein